MPKEVVQIHHEVRLAQIKALWGKFIRQENVVLHVDNHSLALILGTGKRDLERMNKAGETLSFRSDQSGWVVTRQGGGVAGNSLKSAYESLYTRAAYRIRRHQIPTDEYTDVQRSLQALFNVLPPGIQMELKDRQPSMVIRHDPAL